jgi:ABC-2 type transport system permease protein
MALHLDPPKAAGSGTAPAAAASPARVIRPRKGPWLRLKLVWEARDLLRALVRKELKVKYKDSALGFVWSMLNPALYLAVFYLVFSVFLKNGIPQFPLWLLSGLLVWNFVSSVLPSATGTMLANAGLVKKVSFPREVLPLAAVGAGLVHFCLQGVVLLAGLAVFRHAVSPTYLLLLPLAILFMVLFTAALSVMLSAVNVFVRDSQHLLELVLLSWFWLTPIVYPFRQVGDMFARHGIPQWVFMLNPITPIVLVFQRSLYNIVVANHGTLPLLPHVSFGYYLATMLIGITCSALVLIAAIEVFGRLEGSFAEEL